MSALFTVPSGDYVSHMFSMLFGTAWSTVQSLGLGAASSSTSTQNYLGKMFLVYNTAILAVITIYITKILFEGAIGTAHKGEWFGKMYSTFWMPARMVLMLGMLAPVLGGYCFGQVAVLFAVNTGIGVADDLANTGINAVIRTGVVSPPASVPSQRSTVNNLFRIVTCMAAYNADPVFNNVSSGTAPTAPVISEISGGNGVQYFGGTGTNGISKAACGIIDESGLNAAQQSAFSTLETTIKNMDNSGGPIYNIIQRVYGSQGTGANNVANDITGGTGTFNSSQDNELTQAASTFEASLYSVATPENNSTMTNGWANDVQTYGFSELAPLMLSISTYDGSLSAIVGQSPSITPPSPQTKSSNSLKDAMKEANKYINAHNTAPITSPATSSNNSGTTIVGADLPSQPSGSEWISSPFSSIKAEIDYIDMRDIVNPILGEMKSATNITANPLGSVQSFGQGLLNIGALGGTAFLGAAAGSDVVLAGAGSHFLGSGINTDPVAMFVTAVGAIAMSLMAPFFFFGILCAYIIPMMPYTVMIMAIIGYVGAVAVAMVGAPLWIAAHAVPTGEGFVNEASKSGYRLLLSLFAKPALIVFGFFMSLAMFSAGVYLINQTFFTAAELVLETGLNGVSGWLPGITLFFGIIAVVMILVSLYLAMAKWSFGLMNLIPDNALSWVGMQDISMGEERIADEALIGQAYMGARGVGSAASAGIQGAQKGKADAKGKRDQKDAAELAADRHKELLGAVGGDAGASAKGVSEDNKSMD